MYSVIPLSQTGFKSLIACSKITQLLSDRCTPAYFVMFDSKGYVHPVSQSKIRNLESSLKFSSLSTSCHPLLSILLPKYFSNSSFLSIPMAFAFVQPFNNFPLTYCNNQLIDSLPRISTTYRILSIIYI